MFPKIHTFADVFAVYNENQKVFKLHQHDGWFSINYRHAFPEMKNNAHMRELRGIKFYGSAEFDKPENCPIMSRLFHKFYNITEYEHNYETHPVDSARAFLKYDGYLLQFHLFDSYDKPIRDITSYDVNDTKLVALTKANHDKFVSESCGGAMVELPAAILREIKRVTYELIKRGKTALYEFVSENARYNKSGHAQIVLLNIRDNITGEYRGAESVEIEYDGEYLLSNAAIEIRDINDVYSWEGKEGIVLIWPPGDEKSINAHFAKVKSNKHFAIAGFNMNNDKKIYSIIIKNEIDDYVGKIADYQLKYLTGVYETIRDAICFHAKKLREIAEKYNYEIRYIKNYVPRIDVTIIAETIKRDCDFEEATWNILRNRRVDSKTISIIKTWIMRAAY